MKGRGCFCDVGSAPMIRSDDINHLPVVCWRLGHGLGLAVASTGCVRDV